MKSNELLKGSFLLFCCSLVPANAAIAQNAKPAAIDVVVKEPGTIAQQDIVSSDPQDIISSDTDDVRQLDTVVVTGTRRQGSARGDFAPTFELSEDEITSFAAGDLSELLDSLTPLLGGASGASQEQPLILLNGKRISGFREIRSYPPEALIRVDVLPPETGLEYGVQTNQSVINFVLKTSFQQATGELDSRAPTEGGHIKGEGKFNWLRTDGDVRLSVDVSYTKQTDLLESDRDIQASRTLLGDSVGNVTGIPNGAEIDPALSAIAGETVTLAGAPDSAANQPASLSDFNANTQNITDQSSFRTLIPESDSLSLRASLSNTIFEDVSATLNGDLSFTKSTSLRGLPSGTLMLPSSSSFSPFDSDVLVERAFTELGPLEQESERMAASLGVHLNGHLYDWNWTLNGNYQHSSGDNSSQTGIDASRLQATVDDGSANPFGLIDQTNVDPLVVASSSSSNAFSSNFTLSNTPFSLPAGPFRVSLNGDVRHTNQTSSRSESQTDIKSSLTSGAAALSVSVPILAEGQTPVPIGDLSLFAGVGLNAQDDVEPTNRYNVGLNWRPRNQIQVTISLERAELAAGLDSSDVPVVRTFNNRVFDFVTNETLDDVTIVTGGRTELKDSVSRNFRANIGYQSTLVKGLRLGAQYSDRRIENEISSFPDLTPSTEAAFPDRFIRNTSGRLIEIDSRPVNYDERRSRSVGYNFNFRKAFGGNKANQRPRGALDRSSAGQSAGPRSFNPQMARQGQNGPTLGLSFSHNYVLESSLTIAPELPTLDLLSGDSVSSSGLARHNVNAQARLSYKQFTGVLDYRWQSSRETNTGTGILDFSDLGKFNFRAVWKLSNSSANAKNSFFSNSRVQLNIENLFNERQEVVDEMGETPLGFQPDLLDPLGRTVSLSFRTQF